MHIRTVVSRFEGMPKRIVESVFEDEDIRKSLVEHLANSMSAGIRELSISVVVAFVAAAVHWGEVVDHLFVSPHALWNPTGGDNYGALAHFKVL